LTDKDKRALESLVISVIRENAPENLDQLIKLVAAKGFDEAEIIATIGQLEKLRKLHLESSRSEAEGYRKRLFSFSALWYWGVILSCLIAVISVAVIPSNLFPFVYVRYVFGLLILLFTPGFCLIKSLFPKEEMEALGTAVLSVCFSLILILLVALFWNFTPLGLSEMPIVITLLAFSVLTATFTFFRATPVE